MLAFCLLVLAALPPAPPLVHAPDAPSVPTVEAPTGPTAFELAAPAAVALEHEGRIDGAVLISDLGLALTTARATTHVNATYFANLIDGRRVAARVLAVDAARDLALLQLDGPGPFSALALAGSVPETGAPLTALVHPGGQPWNAVPGLLLQRTGSHLGKPDPLRLTARMATPLLGEGGPVVDAQGRLVGIVVAPEPGQNPAEAVAVSVDSIRAFLDHSAATVARFSLLLETVPSGASVAVDGHPVATLTPLRLEHLNLGRHQIVLSAPGLATDVVSVELIRRGSEALHRTLDRGGTLEVTTTAPADIWVDGTLRGSAPLRLQLPSGRHLVDARAPTTQPATSWVEVALGQVVPLELSLHRLTARVSMTTVPPGAQVTANGQPLGTTPLSHVELPAASVQLGIHAPGFHGYEFPIALAPGEDRDLGSYRLEPPYAWLDPRLPPMTRVALDGGPRHVAQRFERVPVGEHRLQVFAPNYYAYSEKLTAADAQTLVLDPPLARYDRLPPRRAAGIGLTGLGMAGGLVAIGLATDASSKPAVAPTLIGAALALGAGIWCLVTSRDAEEAGWSQEKAYAP